MPGSAGVDKGAQAPLVGFEAGEGARPSAINYDLPASTAFVLRCFVPVEVPRAWLRPKPRKTGGAAAVLAEPPARAPASEIPAGAGSLIGRLKDVVAGGRKALPVPGPEPDPFTPYDLATSALIDLAARVPGMRAFAGIDVRADAAAKGRTPLPRRAMVPQSAGLTFAPAGAAPASPAAPTSIGAGYDPDELLANLVGGKVPMVSKSLYGRRSLRYVSLEAIDTATLFVIEDYEVASHLGDYGAGRTVKTFSLLPGERTTLTIKSWRSSSTERSRGENVLDSFSAESADQFEQMASEELHSADESQEAAATGWTQKDTSTGTHEGNVSAGFSVQIGPFGGKLGGGYKGSSSSSSETTSNGSSNSSRKNTVEALAKAMDRHVRQSSSARRFEVNTETAEKTSLAEGIEESTSRDVTNINHSRVLNFVFRQLNQEYFTITSLVDVSIAGTWGEPGDGVEAKLDGIDGVLARFVKPAYVDKVRALILDQLANVYDHEGNRHSFVEEVVETYQPVGAGPGTPPKIVRYYRKNAKLKQTYRGKSVNGVILDVSTRILATDALVVEALLGQGEALDSYNIRLQGAAGAKAEIANDLARASVTAIGLIETGEGRAEAIARITHPPAATVIS